MSGEYFYGIELKGENATKVWDPESKGEGYPRNHKLILKNCVLGADASPDEYNVVEVETMTIADSLKIPIVVLKVGELRQTTLDLEFADAPVTFKLIKGSGPVFIHGNHLEEEFEEFEGDMEEGDEEELLDEDLEDEEEGNPKKKQKVVHNPSKNGKAAAVAATNPSKPANNKKK